MTISTDPDAQAADPYRLPTNVRPLRYDVRLRPSLDDATFTGSVLIALDVATPTQTIVLNAIELDITTVRVEGANEAWSLDESTERLVINLNTEVSGKATLYIEFTGVLND